MSDRSPIEWTRGADGSAGATWNPIRARNKATGALGWHCEHASTGCIHCYSETINEDRLGTRLPFKPGHRKDIEIFLDEKVLLQPLKWRKPRRIFVCSMTDLFGEWVSDAMLDRIVAIWVLAHWHTLLSLTKRSAGQKAYFSGAWRARVAYVIGAMAAAGTISREAGAEAAQRLTDHAVLPNIWLGVSAEDQTRADERVPDLLATPAAVRFVSAEPLIRPIDFATLHGPPLDLDEAPGRAHWIDALTGRHGCWLAMCKVGSEDMGGVRYGRLDWIIVGGESGRDARIMDPRWEEGIRLQCEAAGVAYFRKQWGEWLAWGQTLADGNTNFLSFGKDPARYQHIGGVVIVSRVGKKAAGRLHNGIAHDGFPA